MKQTPSFTPVAKPKSNGKLDTLNLATLGKVKSKIFKAGDKVSSLYSVDGEWYPAVVTKCSVKGYDVRYDQFDGFEEHGKHFRELKHIEDVADEEEAADDNSVEADDLKDEDYVDEGDEEEECAAGCGLLCHRSPPSHFGKEDVGYCCSKCRLSFGKGHGGHCEGRAVGTQDDDEDEEEDEEEEEEVEEKAHVDPWSSSALSGVKYGTDTGTEDAVIVKTKPVKATPFMKKLPTPMSEPSSSARSVVALSSTISDNKVDQSAAMMSKRAGRFAVPVVNRPVPPAMISPPPAAVSRQEASVPSSVVRSGEEVIVGLCEEMTDVVDPRSIRDRFEAGFEDFGLSWKQTSCKQHKRLFRLLFLTFVY